MYCVKKVHEDLYWVGASERRLSLFENVYPVPRGVSYNAYVLLDEKTVLLDTVDKSVSGLFFENLAHVLNGRKLAGLLTESALTGSGGVDYVVIGLGVNLRQRPEDFSPEVAALATSLAAQGYPVDEPVLTEALADALRQALRHLCAPETYVDEYRQMCLTLGRQVRLLPAQEQVTALDIDGQYGLVVRRQDGTTETLRCGEVSVRGLYGYAE